MFEESKKTLLKLQQQPNTRFPSKVFCALLGFAEVIQLPTKVLRNETVLLLDFNSTEKEEKYSSLRKVCYLLARLFVDKVFLKNLLKSDIWERWMGKSLIRRCGK